MNLLRDPDRQRENMLLAALPKARPENQIDDTSWKWIFSRWPGGRSSGTIRPANCRAVKNRCWRWRAPSSSRVVSDSGRTQQKAKLQRQPSSALAADRCVLAQLKAVA
jgi:hypothetical protein